MNFCLKRLSLLLIPLFLTGCVHYDVGVNVAGLHRGQIVQHIELGRQLTSFSQADVEDWLGSMEKRAKRLGGNSHYTTPQDVTLTIPFANAQELEDKFNRFFNPTSQTVTQPPSDLVQLNSHLSTEQNNFFLFQRTHLKLNIDLSALGTIQGQNSRLVGANSLLDLEFRLNTPWGVKILSPESADTESLIKQQGTQTVWYLQPGENNQIEVVFWLPEPLGFGAIAILAIVSVGFYLKYRHFPFLSSAVSQN